MTPGRSPRTGTIRPNVCMEPRRPQVATAISGESTVGSVPLPELKLHEAAGVTTQTAATEQEARRDRAPLRPLRL